MIKNGETYCHIAIDKQKLFIVSQAKIVQEYAISSAKNGVGELNGSEQTPRGWHKIRAKIGDGAPPGAVFVGRRPTGEIYTTALAKAFPGRDWILTRICWLSGLEKGKNRLCEVDTMRRYIYIHGTPDSTRLGEPGSRGCIRMNNADLIHLFGMIPVYTKVLIE